MPLKPAKDQNTYLHEMLASAKQAAGYIAGMTMEKFWDDQKTRDAVAMRLTVIGEAARHITAPTAVQLPKVPFHHISGLRNRIVHDYGTVNFRVVWTIAQEELHPLIGELEQYALRQQQAMREAQSVLEAPRPAVKPPAPKQGPGYRMGL